MNDLNSVLLEGNLTRDPESTVTKGWTTLCTFSIGVNRQYNIDDEKKEEVSFFEIETWGRLAENCFEYLSKGRGVRVVGRLKQFRWETTLKDWANFRALRLPSIGGTPRITNNTVFEKWQLYMRHRYFAADKSP